MTILQQPEALSLSGNLAKFVISSPDDIAFTLKQGSDTIYIANYSPGKNKQIEIDVKDIIEANLKSVFRDSSSPYEQTALAKEFTAVIAGQQVKFTVVKGGVDRLATSAQNFLSHNWLTWQPQTKQVTYSLPEMLTMYSTVASVVKVKAYFPLPDGTYEEQTVQLLSIVTGKAYTIPVGYAVIAKAFSSKLPAFYDVWFETPEGVRLSYIQRYVASSSRSENEQWVVFENSLGGFDTFRAYGDQSLEANHEHQLADFEDETSEYRVDTSREYTQNTGYLTPQERKWMLDFLPSQQKYLFLGNYLRRIIVTEDRTSYVQQELPSSYQFTYKYADAKPYLNLQRTEELPPVLNIQIPDLESFTIPPRLVEFPAQSLSEGVLFPVQNPYSETWATTTIGEILRYVLKYIIDSGDGSSGGIGHHHSNYELLEALHFLEGYLTVHGQKIKAGYADIANDLTDKARSMFLRKDKEDQTEFLQKFLGGLISTHLQSPEFLSGVMGRGFTLQQSEDGTTYAEVDKLMVRMKAIFQSLEIMKTELAGASFMFNASGARMTIVRTERFDHQPAEFADGSEAVFADGSRAVFAGAGEPFIRCWFVADDGETAIENRFRVGNLVRSQTFNIKAGVHEGVSNRFWWREIVGVGKNYIDVAIARCAEGSDLPAVDDVCVQFGDLKDIDYQSAIVLSAYGEGAPYITMYQGINSYSLADKDVFTIGYDKAKRECYVRNYGRMYMGDRNRNRYFDFDGNRFAVAADEIRLGGRKVEDIIIDETRVTRMVLDATGLDENKYYPVTFNLWTGNAKVRIIVSRTLDNNYGVPSYATHGGGFDCRCVWTTNAAGWGTAPVFRNIEYYSATWVRDGEPVIGNIGQLSNGSYEFIHVRGGSKYNITVEGILNAAIALHTDTFTNNEQSVYVEDNITPPVPSLAETGIDIYNHTVKVTADNFYVNSTSGTPIAVFTTNKNGDPIIRAENIDVNNLYVKHLDGAKGSLESGSIGGFELANGRIGTIFSADSSYGLSISNTDLHVGNSSAMVFLGPGSSNTSVGTSSAVRIESNRTGRTVIQLAYNDASLYSAGLRIKSTGGRERKYGVISELPSLGSAFVGTRLSFHAIYSVGQGITMDLSKYSIFLVSSYIGNCSISLPSESQVCEFFGLPQGFENSLPSDFAVEFTIKCTGSSLIRVMGVYNANERLIVEGYPMRAGDSLHLLLMKQGGFRYHCLYYNTVQ